MACYRPVTAWKPLEGGAITFSEKRNSREIKLKCGSCIGCRLELREAWALRCYCESKAASYSWFLTPTYDEEHLPLHGSLVPEHLSEFMRALRRKSRLGTLRYFGVGEYGENTSRPHYHALIFGPDIPDLRKVNSISASSDVFRSELVSEAWPHGDVVIGRASLATARYVAGYVVKKYRGKDSESFYSRVDDATGEVFSVEPEFSRMSRRPGIGLPWLERWWRDIYATGHDSIIVNGKRCSVPRYFRDKLDSLSDVAPSILDDVELRELQRSEIAALDSSPERLAVREACKLAKIAFNESR